MLLSPWITGVGCQLRWVPGVAVGAGLAVTDGVNRLPPFGLSDFSVGVTADVVVVVVVVDCGMGHGVATSGMRLRGGRCATVALFGSGRSALRSGRPGGGGLLVRHLDS